MRDTVAGTYDTGFRLYSPVQGRWISPNPAGLAAVDPTNPQSWNRGAYGNNNLLSFADPSGLDGACDENGNCTVAVWAPLPGGDGGAVNPNYYNQLAGRINSIPKWEAACKVN